MRQGRRGPMAPGWLPLAASPEPRPLWPGSVRLMPAPSEPPVIKPHILVVEDDQPIARLMEALLGSDGYRVTIAGDGESALSAVAAHHPALVLLDLTLPVLDGW